VGAAALAVPKRAPAHLRWDTSVILAALGFGLLGLSALGGRRQGAGTGSSGGGGRQPAAPGEA